MPTFFKKTASKKNSSTKRTFGVKSGKLLPKKAKQTSAKATVENRQTTKPDMFVPSVEAQSGNTGSDALIKQRAKTTLEALDGLLNTSPQQSPRGSNPDAEETNAVYRDEDPEEFNGINDMQEQEQFYGEVVDYERKKAKAVEEQMRLLEKEKEEELKNLQKEIRSLKEELHRTTPLHGNKFFTLSKELREAINDIERIASDNGISLQKPTSPEPLPPPVLNVPLPVSAAPTSPVTVPDVLPSKMETPLQSSPAPVTAPRVVQATQPPIETNTDDKKKGLTKQKMLITGASSAVLVIVASALMSGTFTGKAKVDQKIVDSYLEKNAGQIQGAQTSTSSTPPSNDPSQAEVSFEQSVWEEFRDPSFGIMLQFPKNAVKPVRTDSNVTFIRKTGYLFKVQRIETALTLDEYWNQIKATSLNFEVTKEKFKGKDALKLTLQDMADYPGDRYLLKEGSYIFDVWYATPSNNFPKDDILRAEKMLASLSVTGAQ